MYNNFAAGQGVRNRVGGFRRDRIIRISTANIPAELMSRAEAMYQEIIGGKVVVLDNQTDGEMINALRALVVNDTAKQVAWSQREQTPEGLNDGKTHFHRLLSKEVIEKAVKRAERAIMAGETFEGSFDNFDHRPVITALKSIFHGDDEIRWTIDRENRTFVIGEDVQEVRRDRAA